MIALKFKLNPTLPCHDRSNSSHERSQAGLYASHYSNPKERNEMK